jgi:hypothetical protein
MRLLRPPRPARVLVPALGLAAAFITVTGSALPAQASARRTITQPAPPVTASAFPLEPAGTPPADGDGLIPNPATPAGHDPFALPSNDWLTLADWQAHNGHGWDADSAVGGFSANCPSGSIS